MAKSVLTLVPRIALCAFIVSNPLSMKAEESDSTVLSVRADDKDASSLTDSSALSNQLQVSSAIKLDKGFNGTALVFDGHSSIIVPGTGELSEKVGTGPLYIGCYVNREHDDEGGILLKEEGAFVFGTVPADNSQLHFGVWDKNKGYISIQSPSGSLRSGAWQHVAAIATESELAIYINGKKVTSAPEGVQRQVSNEPISIGVGLDLKKEPTQGAYRGKLDEVVIMNAIPNDEFFRKLSADQTEDFRSTLVSATRPPLQKAAKEILNPEAPKIAAEGEKGFRMENSYLSLIIDTKDGLALSKLYNKYIDANCIIPNKASSVFYLTQDGERFDSSEFKVTSTEIKADTESKTLVVDLDLPKRKLKAIAKIKMGKGPETEWSLSFTNGSSEAVSVRPGFPFFTNIQVGTDLDENYYFFPLHSGWVGKRPALLGLEYGTRCWLPAFDVSNPLSGGGVYTWPKDTTGQLKSMLLKKTREDGTIGTDYNILREKPLKPFDGDVGVSMGSFLEPHSIPPKGTYEIPNIVLGVHGGTAIDGLKRYSEWAQSTWYKHDPIPEFLKRDFQMIAVQHDAGNFGFVKGGISPEHKWIASEQIKAGREDNHLQFAMWWHHPAWGIDPDNGWGDYGYNEDAGGQAAFAEEIKRCQEKGSHVSLYLCSRALGPNTKIGQAHTKEWGYMAEPGVYNNDWGALNFCTHIPEWQDYLGTVYTRLMKDLKPDGLYLDTSAEVLRCKNPLHKHSEDLMADQVRLLKTIHDAIKSVNPQAMFMVEFCGADVFSQYVDASWVQTWAHPLAKNFNDYDLCYFRYVFPQVKLIEWGQNAETFNVDSKRAFFNGIGVSRGDLTLEQTMRQAAMTRILRENGDAFSDLQPEALIKTEMDNVYANKFPTAGKTVYMIYNKNTEAISGPILAVDANENRHFVDASNNTELKVSNKDGKSTLSATIPSYEVACILNLPNLLKVTQNQDSVTVSLNKETEGATLKAYYPIGDSLREVPATLSGSEWTIGIPQEAKKSKLIIKLFKNEFLLDERICLF